MHIHTHIPTDIHIYNIYITLKLGVRDEEYKQPEGRRFPDEGQSDSITCQVLTSEFLIYGTEVCDYIY